MDIGNAINTFGLILDISGVIGLFIFQVPNKDLMNSIQIYGDYDDKKEDKYRNLSFWSFILVILGFVFQLISNFF